MDKFTIRPTFDLTRSGTRVLDGAGVIVTKETGWISPDGGTLI